MKVKQWVAVLERLADVADSLPHVAYGAITHGLAIKWSNLSRTTPDIDHLVYPIENSIRTSLLPKLIGRGAPNELERCLFFRLVGLNIGNPSSFASEQYNASQQGAKPLVELILSHDQSYPYEVLAELIDTKNTIKARRCQLKTEEAEKVSESGHTIFATSNGLKLEKRELLVG